MSRQVVYGIACGVVCLMFAAGGCERISPPSPMADDERAKDIHLALTSGVAASGGGGSAPVAQVGTGWATLKGTFLFDGTPPSLSRLSASKNPEVCAPGGTGPPDESLIVDPSTRGIANVAIYLRGASRIHESAEPNDQTVLFDQKQCIFLSHVFPLRIGQTMQIKNSDSVGHNTNISAFGFNQTIPLGQSINFKPEREKPMPIPVSCSVHPWMRAYVVARNNGYVAITDANGRFEIANLPAGEELEFQVWHEHAAGPGGALVIKTPEASQLEWSNRGRFKVKLEQDQPPREINLGVPASAFRD